MEMTSLIKKKSCTNTPIHTVWPVLSRPKKRTAHFKRTVLKQATVSVETLLVLVPHSDPIENETAKGKKRSLFHHQWQPQVTSKPAVLHTARRAQAKGRLRKLKASFQPSAQGSPDKGGGRSRRGTQTRRKGTKSSRHASTFPFSTSTNRPGSSVWHVTALLPFSNISLSNTANPHASTKLRTQILRDFYAQRFKSQYIVMNTTEHENGLSPAGSTTFRHVAVRYTAPESVS